MISSRGLPLDGLEVPDGAGATAIRVALGLMAAGPGDPGVTGGLAASAQATAGIAATCALAAALAWWLMLTGGDRAYFAAFLGSRR